MWVRLHYVYPYPHVDEVIPLMAEGKILPYLDIPFQHASPKVLKAMKRPAAAENTLARIKAWREICPELMIRSTFIAGFPGETEDDFQMLLDFSRKRNSIASAASPIRRWKARPPMRSADHVPEEVKEERRARLMELQADISAERLAARVGQTHDRAGG